MSQQRLAVSNLIDFYFLKFDFLFFSFDFRQRMIRISGFWVNGTSKNKSKFICSPVQFQFHFFGRIRLRQKQTKKMYILVMKLKDIATVRFVIFKNLGLIAKILSWRNMSALLVVVEWVNTDFIFLCVIMTSPNLGSLCFHAQPWVFRMSNRLLPHSKSWRLPPHTGVSAV